MVISHKYKFIFIAVPKTASTSLENVLGDHGLVPTGAKHMSAQTARDHVGQLWDEYYSFAFVRNPWDWLVSWYTYRQRDVLKNPAHPNHRNYTGNMTFEEFLQHDYPAVRRTQLSRLSGDEGRLLVDYVGHYETIAKDIHIITDRTGMPRLALPHLFRSDRREYRHYYNPATRQHVEEYYKDDIKAFNYAY